MLYPGLIKNRCGVYCYRLIFPPSLRQYGAPRETRFSLGTKNRAKTGELWIHAFQLGRLLLDELLALVQEVDQEVGMAEISEIMKAKIAAKREQIRLGEQLAALQDQINEQRLEALRSRKELATAQAVTQKAKELARTAVGIAQRTQGQLIESRRTADALATLPTTINAKPVVPVGGVLVAPSVCGQSLEWLVARFNEYSEHVKKNESSSMSQRKSNLARFLDILGPLDSAALVAADITHYREVIRTIPKNLAKQPIWKERPEDPVLRRNWYLGLGKQGLPSLSEQGQMTHFHDVKPFLKWLKAERHIAEDFSDMLIPIKNDADYEEGGQPFTQEQLGKLVNELWLANAKHPYERPKDWHFWAPLLALTTGMRGDEIGRLTATHVVNVGGVAMLNVPGTKNPNADRLIPLPSVVLNAGFMQLVEWARRSGDDARLFPDWVHGGGKSAKKYSASLGKWFNYEQGAGLLAKLDIWKADQQVSFHSLRHTFITAAHHTDIKLELMQMIVGHGPDLRKTYGLPTTKDKGSSAPYIKPGVKYSPRMQEACAKLRNVIDSVDFGCDLTEVNWLNWRRAKKMGNLK
ncbi:tyrosine-type recombinase/integrase [Aeromonas sp. s9]|uniref:tyrosine-type recombinase/integrase n=1 Tax=Aeromonas sp. s9 TaxID=3138490 RepID=UPI0034A42655